jgi:hypothetical protein
VGKKESRNRSVRLGDNPHFHIVLGSIGAENSEAILEREFIFFFVLFAKLALISHLMFFEKLKGILIGLF